MLTIALTGILSFRAGEESDLENVEPIALTASALFFLLLKIKPYHMKKPIFCLLLLAFCLNVSAQLKVMSNTNGINIIPKPVV